MATYTAAASTPRRRFPALVAWVGGLLVVLVALGVSDDGQGLDGGRTADQLPRLLLAFGALLGVPLWVGWAAGMRRARAVEEGRRRGRACRRPPTWPA